jgi:FtsP/CotA-like multicopper oxidase with cupredoxin domain
MQMGPIGPSRVIRMGQSPGTHWYHAHKHGSTAINVANGMTGAFIIEGQYDDDLNRFYGANWTRTQKVMVINQLGVSPNLLRGTPTDKGPDFSVNGRISPVVKMYPGEVQMWRILNTSGRSGAFFVGPPKADPTAKVIDPQKDFQWRQLAQDGVQFADINYQKSLDKSFLMASGNRVDLLVKAPMQPQKEPYKLQVMPSVATSDLLTALPVTLLTIEVAGSGPEMQFIKHAPKQPYFLADITNDEIKGTKTIVFNSLQPGSAAQHTINGQPFSGEVGEVVLLNTAEEWTVMNATNTGTGPANIDHPFHIHINPFQITEVFDPNETILDPSTGQQVNKYVFDKPTVAGQCQLDPNDPESWHPCTRVSQPYRIWWDVFPIPSGRQITVFGRNVIVPGYFKMRSRFVDFPGLFVMHCHILAHEDRGMMTVVEVRPLKLPYAHQ